jgi:NAD(P)-dependent dehydrogenase (short-subunit alcohol dehydrogenase family)
MMTSLADKTALITGASRGMGRATALALAAAGARVIVHFGRNADEAKTVVDRIRAAGGRADASAAICDLAPIRCQRARRKAGHELTGPWFLFDANFEFPNLKERDEWPPPIPCRPAV